MPKTVTIELPEESHNAFFAVAYALSELAGESAPTPEQLMQMALNPEAAAALYEAFVRKASPQITLASS